MCLLVASKWLTIAESPLSTLGIHQKARLPGQAAKYIALNFSWYDRHLFSSLIVIGVPAVRVIRHKCRNSVMPRVLSWTQVNSRSNVIDLPADISVGLRCEHGKHDFPAVKVNGDGMLHNAARGFSVSGELYVNVLRGAVKCMCVRLRMPLIGELLNIRATQSVWCDHEQNARVTAAKELFHLAFNLHASSPRESIT